MVLLGELALQKPRFPYILKRRQRLRAIGRDFTCIWNVLFPTFAIHHLAGT
jgi:hypothetical protein